MVAQDLNIPLRSLGFNFDADIEESFYDRDPANEELDVEIQNDAPGKPTILSFGGCGVQEKTGEAFYGWSKAIYDFPQYTHISVRDSYHCWYFNGIRGASVDILSTLDFLTGLLLPKPPLLVTCGTSGGGFAALLFGSMLRADHILALAPQTLLKDGIKSQADGHIHRVYAALNERPVDKFYTDLSNLSFDTSDTEIVYSPEEEVDTFHARRMEDKAGIRYTLSRGTHGEVAKYFRDDGLLNKKLASYL